METGIIRTETKSISKKVVKLLNVVIEQHTNASNAIKKGSIEKALEVIETHEYVTRLSIELMSDLEFLITQAPKSKDLRRTLGFITITRQLKRIGSYAKHISRFVIKTGDKLVQSSVKRIRKIQKEVMNMLNDLIIVIEKEMPDLANELIDKDNIVDKLLVDIRKEIIISLGEKTDDAQINQRLFVLDVSNSLERAADHIVTICKMIIYIYDGEYKI